LQKAIEDEVAAYLDAGRGHLDAAGRRLVVRNGHKPPRTILSGLGPIEVKQPRVNDRRVDADGVRFRFTSKILPPYLRKTRAIEDLVPWLYLKGISTGEMGDALVHLGFDGSGLSSTSVTRMLEAWQHEYGDWIWQALAKVFPSTRHQRCWVHKTMNVLDKLPKGQQPAAKSMLHEVWMSATREDAIKAFDRFVEVYGTKWPRATACLEKDRAALLAFYDFPAEHWQHLRTGNPIESTFATVRLRTYRTKGPGSRAAGLAMAFKLALKAESRWRKLNGSAKLQDLIDGVVFVDGERKAA
jgi:transposase-like protein